MANPPREVVCAFCGKVFKRYHSQIKRARNNCCSRSCAARMPRGQSRDARERFAAKVELDEASGCHLWTGGRDNSGYGRVWWMGRLRAAHRVAWRIHHGDIPDDMHVCHKCDVRACVNPDHLFLGTPSDNIRDCVAKGRKNPARGERCARSKLTASQVRAIRRSAEPADVLAGRFGVSPKAVNSVRRCHTWRHLA